MKDMKGSTLAQCQFYIGQNCDYPDSYFFFRYFHSKLQRNITGMKNKSFDELIESVITFENKEERARVYNMLNKVIYEEAHIIPLYYGDIFDGYYQKYVNGINYPHLGFLYIRMKDIWLDR